MTKNQVFFDKDATVYIYCRPTYSKLLTWWTTAGMLRRSLHCITVSLLWPAHLSLAQAVHRLVLGLNN